MRSPGRRVRRNSAGDEISSILDHETTPNNGVQDYGALNGLVVMGEPQFHQFHTRDMTSLSPPCCAEEDEMRITQGGTSHLDQHELSSITSSSLNTTVITKLEVSDR